MRYVLLSLILLNQFSYAGWFGSDDEKKINLKNDWNENTENCIQSCFKTIMDNRKFSKRNVQVCILKCEDKYSKNSKN